MKKKLVTRGDILFYEAVPHKIDWFGVLSVFFAGIAVGYFFISLLLS